MSRVPSIGPARSFQIGNGILVNSTGIMKDGEYITDGGGGMPGLSAYEIAVSHGFIGTEQEWLASLPSTVPGPQGIDGQNGTNGQNGYTPVKGVDYFDGAKGDPGDDGYTPIKGVDYFDGAKGDPGDDGIGIPSGGSTGQVLKKKSTSDYDTEWGTGGSGSAWGSITGTLSDQSDLNSALSGKAPTSHSHAPGDVTGTAVITTDSRLSDARTPTAHDQAISTITNLQTTLTGKEPANSNIQTHVAAAHAPSNAQKNSDITKAEIEAKLTGEISTHTHAGGGGGLGYALPLLSASQSTTTDAQTLYWGGFAVAPSTTANRWRVYILKPGTIKVAQIYSYAGTAGSAEAWVMNIRKNDTTDTLIASLSVSTNDRLWANYALSIAMAAGDYIEIKEVCPTWATNPATVTRRGAIYIE